MNPIVNGAIEATCGKIIYNLLKLRYGWNVYIFLIRGKTGDIFLYFRFLESYIRQNGISNYLCIGDGKQLKAIARLYPQINCPIIETSSKVGLMLQRLFILYGGSQLDMTHSLMWDTSLPMHRCAIRMTDRFSFVDSFTWFLLGLKDECAIPSKPIFNSLNKESKAIIEKANIEKGKSVVISPVAYCVKPLSDLFWAVVISELKNRGYKVFVMLDERCERNVYGVPSVFFKYADSKAILEYAGGFIGLRSGFCDIVSGIDCAKVILYPSRNKDFDGNVHRADIAYSSFKKMGLANDANEIEVNFCRNITDYTTENEEFGTRIFEEKELLSRIFISFPRLSAR